MLRKTATFACVSTAFTLSTIATATAATFNPAPLFSAVDRYSITSKVDGNPTDIYFPNPGDLRTGNYSFPVALLLQGALVDKSFYSDYASQVARYGFVVVVPNNSRSLVPGFSGLFSETAQVDAVLSQAVIENADPTSPISGIVDTQKLGLLGHSFGAAVGLSVIADKCLLGTCSAPFTRPKELLAGAFYGANLADPFTGEFIPINNSGIAVALVQGDRDTRALPGRALTTYDNIQSPPKAFVTLAGANHFGITNINNPPGAIPDLLSPTLAQETSVETIARWSGLFLRANVLNDQGARDYVFFSGDALDANVTVKSKPVPESSATVGLFVVGAIGAASWWKRQKAS